MCDWCQMDVMCATDDMRHPGLGVTLLQLYQVYAIIEVGQGWLLV